jgi:hypothetical protein
MAFGYVDALKNIKNKSFGASEVTTKDPSIGIAYLCSHRLKNDTPVKNDQA